MADEITSSTLDRIEDEDEDVLYYFKNMTAVVFVQEPSVRVSIRKVLSYLGFQTRNIFIPNTIFEAEGYIDNGKVNIVITSDNVDKKSGLLLLAPHLKVHPNRMDALFCLIVSYQTMMIAPSDVMDQDIEMMMIKPFSMDDFKTKFLMYFKDSIKPNDKKGMIEEAKEKILEENWAEALELFNTLYELDNKDPQIVYHLGNLWRCKGDDQKASVYFSETLEVTPTHRRALTQMVEIKMSKMDFQKAQGFAEAYVKHYPLSPHKIPEFLKIAILAKSYDFVMKYCEMAQESPQLDEESTRKITAGLAVGAKELIRSSKKELALSCLYQASRYCIRFPKILTSVVSSYIQLGEMSKADHLLSRIIEDEDAPIEKHVLNLEIIYKVGDVQKALLLALALLQRKVHDKKVFEIAIEGSMKLERNKEVIVELIQDACVKYPEFDVYYKKI